MCFLIAVDGFWSADPKSHILVSASYRAVPREENWKLGFRRLAISQMSHLSVWLFGSAYLTTFYLTFWKH